MAGQGKSRVEKPAPEASDDERIRWLKQEYWIGTDFSKEIRKLLDELLLTGTQQRIQSLALIGNANSGKSAMLRKYAKDKNPKEDSTDLKTVIRVLYAVAPFQPTVSALFGSILNNFGSFGPTREKVEDKQRRLVQILKELQTEMLIIDESNRLVAGSNNNVKQMMAALRSLSEVDLGIPIVLAGLDDVRTVISQDPQTASRYTCVDMKRWEGEDDLIKWLKAIDREALLPLRKQETVSRIWKPRFVAKLVALSEGLLGEMVDILRVLSVDAIKSKSEEISLKTLNKKHLKTLNWIPPSERQYGGL